MTTTNVKVVTVIKSGFGKVAEIEDKLTDAVIALTDVVLAMQITGIAQAEQIEELKQKVKILEHKSTKSTSTDHA